MIEKIKKDKIKEKCILIIKLAQQDFKKLNSRLNIDKETIRLKNNEIDLLVVEFLKENGINQLDFNNNIIATDNKSINVELNILQDNSLDITIINIPNRTKIYYNSDDLELFYEQLKYQTIKVLKQCSN